MPESAVEALITDPAGFYVDGTFGRGGHARRILAALEQDGRLLAIDRDPQAVLAARALEQTDRRFVIEHGAFSRLADFVEARGMSGRVDGVLLDLGVSSPQLDEAERGFSFLQDGPLDMRMDPREGESAATWLAQAGETEIADVLYHFGEERHSRRIARAIVKARLEAPIDRTARLAEIVKAANPAWEKHKHPATRAFQAIRIHINRELDELATCLQQAVDVLRPGGRLVVISFHSLEDRLVKQFMRRESEGEPLPRGVPVRDEQLVRRLQRVGKAIRAEAVEVGGNPRARSAIMRVAQRTTEQKTG